MTDETRKQIERDASLLCANIYGGTVPDFIDGAIQGAERQDAIATNRTVDEVMKILRENRDSLIFENVFTEIEKLKRK